jgi:hypothetical protein
VGRPCHVRTLDQNAFTTRGCPSHVFVTSMCQCILPKRQQRRPSGGSALQEAREWGWALADAATYASIAELYGCEYKAMRRGKPLNDSKLRGSDGSEACPVSVGLAQCPAGGSTPTGLVAVSIRMTADGQPRRLSDDTASLHSAHSAPTIAEGAACPSRPELCDPSLGSLLPGEQALHLVGAC